MYCLLPLHTPCSCHSILPGGWLSIFSAHVTWEACQKFSPQALPPTFLIQWIWGIPETCILTICFEKQWFILNKSLGSEYLDSTVSKMPLLITLSKELRLCAPLWHIIQFSICLGLASCSYPVECFPGFAFSNTGIVPGWLLVGERYTHLHDEYEYYQHCARNNTPHSLLLRVPESVLQVSEE